MMKRVRTDGRRIVAAAAITVGVTMAVLGVGATPASAHDVTLILDCGYQWIRADCAGAQVTNFHQTITVRDLSADNKKAYAQAWTRMGEFITVQDPDQHGEKEGVVFLAYPDAITTFRVCQSLTSEVRCTSWYTP